MRLFLPALLLVCTNSLGQFPNIKIDNGDPNEPSIWINPKNTQQLVAGANINKIYYSHDGGLTWTKQSVSSPFGVWGDPCIMTDTSGNFYYFHLSNPPQGNWIDRIVCQKSTDGGVTWSSGSYMGLNGTHAQDKEWAVFDAASQTIYVTWTEFDDYGSGNPNDSSFILFSKSTDFGNSWTPALRINRLAGDCIDSDNTTEGAVPAVGPDGTVYVCWSNRDTLFFDRSTDGGTTWLNEDVFVDEQPGGWDYNIPGIARSNGLPVTKCDLSSGPYQGTIYINWSDQRNGSDNTDVFISKSTDGGFTWSPSLKINDDASSRHQFFSWMDVDQTDGTIYILFYDRRNHADQHTDVYLAYSTDGGSTFINTQLSEESFDPNTNVFFGDYTNISAFNGKVAPIWTHQQGNVLSLWTALVDIATLEEDDVTLKPTNFLLYQNVPNPFRHSTSIEMDILQAGYYSLFIYDLTGRRVASLFSNRLLQQGYQKFSLDAEAMGLKGSGFYYTLESGHKVHTKKLILLPD